MTNTILWPAYFDAQRTRREGRRVSTDAAIDDPTVETLAKAAQQVGYNATIDREKSHPRETTPRGRVVIHGTDSEAKTDVLHAVAAYAPLV